MVRKLLAAILFPAVVFAQTAMPGVTAPAPWKYNSNTEIGLRNPSVATVQGNAGGTSVKGGTASTDHLNLYPHTQSLADSNTGRVNLFERMQFMPSQSVTVSTGLTFVDVPTSLTITSAGASPAAYYFHPTINYTSTPGFGVPPFLFIFQPAIKTQGANITIVNPVAFFSNPTITADGFIFTLSDANLGVFQDSPIYTTASGGSFAAGSTHNGFVSSFQVAGGTFETRKGIRITNASGAGSLTNQIGIEIDALAKGGTLDVGIRSAIAAGAGQWFLLDTGGANSALAGKLAVGSNTAPTATLEVTGTGAFSGDVTVPDEVYDATNWDASLEVPTKNAVRDKIESLSLATGTAITTKTKTVNEDVTNSAALQADDHLTGLTLGATGIYVVYGTLISNVSASAGPDLKIAFDVATSTLNNMNISVTSVQSGATANEVNLVATADDTSPGEITHASSATHIVRFSGTIDVTNAGTLQLRWAQNTATVGHTTTLQRGSFMSVYKQ